MDLHLVDHERHRARTADHRQIRRPEVAHAELAHLALPLQVAEGRGDLLRHGEVVGPVQHVEVDAIGPQPLEGALARPHDVLAGEVPAMRGRPVGVAAPADAALAGDQDLVPHARDFPEHAAEDLFAQAVAIDVGVIEVRVAGFVGRQDPLPAGGLPLCRQSAALHRSADAHAAVGEARGDEGTGAEWLRVHAISMVRRQGAGTPADTTATGPRAGGGRRPEGPRDASGCGGGRPPAPPTGLRGRAVRSAPAFQ